jgi:hypothetical protein
MCSPSAGPKIISPPVLLGNQESVRGVASIETQITMKKDRYSLRPLTPTLSQREREKELPASKNTLVFKLNAIAAVE